MEQHEKEGSIVFADSNSAESAPLKSSGYECMNFPDPALLISFFDKEIADGHVTLHPWQLEELQRLANAKPNAQHPYKYCLRAANGSGKDKFVIAPFTVWFALCKVRSRVIITSSSGVQLTSQTENYIRDLAGKVNTFFGVEIFRIRQRYIYCRLSGSEIRMFATDEKGKAEGYHPIDANSEMAIIVNEGKSVTEEIHGALRRCTGYNYWLEVSTPGEPTGFFYRAATTWVNNRVITSFDCPHLSEEDRAEDKRDLGENSALYRSKHLALFTSIGGDVVIPLHLVDALLAEPPSVDYPDIKDSVGIDIAAGGDENSLCWSGQGKVKKQHHFREVDTTVTADRIEQILKDWGFEKSNSNIYADDGGVGHAIIDVLVMRGWNINRVLNQWAAINKRNFGNRGAENWYRVKRLLEEKLFDISGLDTTTREQLTTRHYKQTSQSGRIFLESKKEAKADGRPSPDRADAFILSLTGLVVDTFLNTKAEPKKRPVEKFSSRDAVLSHYENAVTYGKYNDPKPGSMSRVFNSLKRIYANRN